MRANAQKRASLTVVAFVAGLVLLLAVSVFDVVTSSLDGLELGRTDAATELDR